MKNQNTESWWVSVATLGDVRFSSAPGSVASALTLPFILAFYHFGFSLHAYVLVIGLVALLSYIAIEKSINYFDTPDPKEIVLDECLGMLITFCGVPISAFSIVVGFLLFRLFDISKVFGIGFLERIPGSVGILADDIVAGLFAMIILQFLVPIVCG